MTRIKKHRFLLSLLLLTTITSSYIFAELTSLSKNDPYPIFSTLSLDDRYLLTAQQLAYTNKELSEKKKSHVLISITPFGQNASRGKTIKGKPCPTIFDPTLPLPCPDQADTPLGDLTGKTGMIPLLYGSFPTGIKTFPGGETGYLNIAFDKLFPDQEPQTVNSELYIDPLQIFGYFSFPLEYRKRGLRFEVNGLFSNTFGFSVQTGVSSIRQVKENTINTTADGSSFPASGTSSLDGTTVNTYLMDQLDNIANQIGFDLSNVIETSIEEVRLNLFWRQAFEMNKDSEKDWSRFLLIPYFQTGASFSPGKTINPNHLFAAPFANNGHPSIGLTTGINLSFIDSIEIGGEIGFTHFFSKNFCNYPVPNSQFQTNLFPFKTDIKISPGNNWYFGGRLSAYHFLGNLSMHFEWFVLDHKQDSINLKTADAAFLPTVLEKTTTFKTKFGNAALNYDVAPNIGLGFLWQMPFSQRNAYRSSTIMAGINFTF